jgi:uncharacterized membrane protein YciS (DUF1049 family)
VIALLAIVFVLGIFCGVFLVGLASMASRADRREPYCESCVWGPKGPER